MVGVIHFDIKPENILVNRLGKVKIADFGVSKIMSSLDNDQLSIYRGTLMYQPLEILEKKRGFSGRKIDLWSLGVTFYKLAFGKFPYLGKNAKDLAKKIKTEEIYFPDKIEKKFIHFLS